MNGKYPSLKYSLAVFFTLIFFKGTQAASDTITIQGTVIDAVSKQPISAAQISVLNRNFNAVTDSVGNFSIKLASSSDLLIINAFDYVEKEVAVRGRHDLSIDMFSNQFRKNTNIKESANNTTMTLE